MDVEGVRLERTVFDRPIFNGSNFGSDGRLFVGLEDSLFLVAHRNIELDRTVGAAEFLGEIELPLRRYRCMSEVGKLEPGR